VKVPLPVVLVQSTVLVLLLLLDRWLLLLLRAMLLLEPFCGTLLEEGLTHRSAPTSHSLLDDNNVSPL
jgi:hypothetical protein